MSSSAPTPLTKLWPGCSYFDHQEIGIRWMLEKEHDGTWVLLNDKKTEICLRGGLQCDDMGLGKTIQTMAVIVNHRVAETLIMAPLAMVETWIDVGRAAGCRVYELATGQGTAEWVERDPDSTDTPVKKPVSLYITNYDKLMSRPSCFKRVWGRIILDEAHRIRNPSTELAKRVRGLKASLRWALTGTPLVNRHKDVLSLLAFLGLPYTASWMWQDERHEAILAHLMIHRSLDSLRGVLATAPPKPVIQHLELDFTTSEEREFYYGVQSPALESIEKYKKDRLDRGKMFAMLLRLRQISVHPQIYIDAKRRELPKGWYDRADWKGASTKMDAVAKILREDKGTHHYIIFCQFHEEMTLLAADILRRGLVEKDHLLMYHGGLSGPARTEVLKTSKTLQKTSVLLLQLQAGGVGLNLQEYDRILFMSPWWTSSMMDQAIARAVRMGQTKTVKVWHLRLAAESNDMVMNIDRLMYGKAMDKAQMQEELFAIAVQKRVIPLEDALMAVPGQTAGDECTEKEHQEAETEDAAEDTAVEDTVPGQ